jgi:hypothetical protein
LVYLRERDAEGFKYLYKALLYDPFKLLIMPVRVHSGDQGRKYMLVGFVVFQAMSGLREEEEDIWHQMYERMLFKEFYGFL